MRVIHTGDWQIGKPFARVGDPYKRSLLQQARIEAVRSLGALATETGAELVLVRATCRLAQRGPGHGLGRLWGHRQIPVPVVAIPGNHDNGGPGSVWSRSSSGGNVRLWLPT